MFKLYMFKLYCLLYSTHNESMNGMNIVFQSDKVLGTGYTVSTSAMKHDMGGDSYTVVLIAWRKLYQLACLVSVY